MARFGTHQESVRRKAEEIIGEVDDAFENRVEILVNQLPQDIRHALLLKHADGGERSDSEVAFGLGRTEEESYQLVQAGLRRLVALTLPDELKLTVHALDAERNPSTLRSFADSPVYEQPRPFLA